MLIAEEIVETDYDLYVICEGEKHFAEAISARYIGRKISEMLKDSDALKERVLKFLKTHTEGFNMARLMDYQTLEDSQKIIKSLYEGLLDDDFSKHTQNFV